MHKLHYPPHKTALLVKRRTMTPCLSVKVVDCITINRPHVEVIDPVAYGTTLRTGSIWHLYSYWRLHRPARREANRGTKCEGHEYGNGHRHLLPAGAAGHLGVLSHWELTVAATRRLLSPHSAGLAGPRNCIMENVHNQMYMQFPGLTNV